MTTYLSKSGKNITAKVNSIISEITDLAKRGKIKLRCSGRCVAIFCAETLDNTVHVGWHYAGKEDSAGSTFNYDHGAGIHRNEDGLYLWISPATNELLLSATETVN
jgi:hypothetical protein